MDSDGILGVQTCTRAVITADGVQPHPRDAELTRMGYEFSLPRALESALRRAAKAGLPMIVTEHATPANGRYWTRGKGTAQRLTQGPSGGVSRSEQGVSRGVSRGVSSTADGKLRTREQELSTATPSRPGTTGRGALGWYVPPIRCYLV